MATNNERQQDPASIPVETIPLEEMKSNTTNTHGNIGVDDGLLEPANPEGPKPHPADPDAIEPGEADVEEPEIGGAGRGEKPRPESGPEPRPENPVNKNFVSIYVKSII